MSNPVNAGRLKPILSIHRIANRLRLFRGCARPAFRKYQFRFGAVQVVVNKIIFTMPPEGEGAEEGGEKARTSQGRRYVLGPLKTSQNLVKTSTNATLGPHAPEVGPKMRQVGPKMPQDRPKMAPRGLQMAPRPLQEPKMSPRCPKIAPRRPQHGAPEHGKRCSRRGTVHFLRNWPIFVLPFAFLFSRVLSQPHLASRWLRMARRCPKMAPKWLPNGSKMTPKSY